MIKLFTVVAFTPEGIEQKFITPSSYDIRRGNNRVADYNKRTRTFISPSQARVYRKRLLETVLPAGTDCRILGVFIDADGSHGSWWVDD